MDKQFLEEIKKQLLEKRETLLKKIQTKSKELVTREIGDSIDDAFNSVEKETLFEVSDNDKKTIKSIDYALQKIETNKFGICENCEKNIPEARLKALPISKFCIECQLKMEN